MLTQVMIRFFDLFFSGLALLVLSPLLIPVAIVLRFTGEGHIFYTQERIGRGGRKFALLKFATMLKDSPSLGTGHITLTNDPRVLPVGRFLRKTKINELPQLINIFLGDMSIVGPRPLTARNFGYYDPDARAKIASVRPGLTGVGSIVFRNEERFLRDRQDPVRFYKEHIAPHKAELELWYLQRQSLLTYFKLIILTAWVVLFPQSKIFTKAFPDLPPPPPELS